MTARAAIYTRISQDRLGDQAGVARQEQDCLELVSTKGWELVDVYRDNDRSAFKPGVKRRGYTRMLADVKRGLVDVIVCWHPDRLHRSPRELEDFIDLLESSGATVATVTAGDYDLATADGRLVARITGSVARKESEDKARRARRKHLEKAQRGKVSGGGVRPFGFREDRVTVDPDEAALIVEAAERVLAGDGVSTIARDWDARGLRTVTGRRWNRTTIRDFLTSARVVGKRTHRGKIVADAEWPAILDEATWHRVRRVLLDPDRTARFAASDRRWLLTRVVHCTGCGRPMVSRAASRGGRHRYVCAKDRDPEACGGRSVVAEPTDLWVGDLVVYRLSSDGWQRAVHGRSQVRDDTADRIVRDEAALEQLARDHYVDGLLSRAEFLAAREPLELRLAGLRRDADRAAGRSGLVVPAGQDVRQVWDGLPVSRRVEVVRQLVERVDVSPARPGTSRFDPSRLDVVWRV